MVDTAIEKTIDRSDVPNIHVHEMKVGSLAEVVTLTSGPDNINIFDIDGTLVTGNGRPVDEIGQLLSGRCLVAGNTQVWAAWYAPNKFNGLRTLSNVMGTRSYDTEGLSRREEVLQILDDLPICLGQDRQNKGLTSRVIRNRVQFAKLCDHLELMIYEIRAGNTGEAITITLTADYYGPRKLMEQVLKPLFGVSESNYLQVIAMALHTRGVVLDDINFRLIKLTGRPTSSSKDPQEA